MKLRKKTCHIFQSCYTDLCATYNVPMIFPIKAHLHQRMLDFNGDRVKLDEWRPIIKALSIDRSLHFIAIRSKNSCSKVLEHIDSETKSRKVTKLPVLLTNFIFKRIIMSLSRCLTFNSHLKCLELDGILLSGDYLHLLLEGLEKTTSLQHLSLHRCPLGDEGCQLVCVTLRNLPHILTVDMSGCNISAKGACSIGSMLQYQNLNRYGENWKQSLRYRVPDTEVMPGLRRVTLNHNPLVGDSGVGHIISVLRDDLWLKALDLQNVGLTNEGGKELLSMLHENKTLSVLDVHNNPKLDKTLFESIMNVLATNNVGKVSEYHWIREDTLYLPRKPLYQSRDPSSTQRPLKSIDLTNADTHPYHNGTALVHQTKSSVVPTVTSNQLLVSKRAYSASAVVPCCSKLMDSAFTRVSVDKQSDMKEKSSTKSKKINKWDHINAAGDYYNIHDTRAKLQELSSKLEEEVQKRLEAERQKADLELRLKKFAEEHKKAMLGHVLMDNRVVHEITEAFAAFTGFLTIFDQKGLQLGSLNNSEILSDSTAMSSNSQPQSFRGKTTAKEVGKVSSLGSLSSSSISLKESSSNWKTESDAPSSSSDGSTRFLVTEAVQCSDDNSKSVISAAADQEKAQTHSESICTIPPRETAKREKPHQPSEIFIKKLLRTDLNSQLWDMLKNDPVSFISHRENNSPQKWLRSSTAAGNAPNTESERSKSESLDLQTEPSEPVDVNALSLKAMEEDESNRSWYTQSSLSDDSSPSSTLTEIFAN